jgi:hypothetical protein
MPTSNGKIWTNEWKIRVNNTDEKVSWVKAPTHK